MKKVLYFSMFLFLFQNITLLGVRSGQLEFSKSSNKETDLKMINLQIESLENLKEHYLGRAARLRNRADRLQFSAREDGLISAQKYWKSANECDRIADQIQDEIDSLEEERVDVDNRSAY